ncbi:MAG: hypothetical protein M3680_29785 [Myxococcota bacterium]|nr:hypothetical protein [Myxococcota bacterium]
MVVFSNHRLGPAVELLVSDTVAAGMLRATAAAARPRARAHWELELVRWLEHRATVEGIAVLDVADLAWTPENFERQRQFVLDAIAGAAQGSPHLGDGERGIDEGPAGDPAGAPTRDLARDLTAWGRLIAAHPRESVQFGRRWRWHANV